MRKHDDRQLGELETHHGGIDFAELARHGIRPEHIVDFSSNILPYGPSALVLSAIRQVAVDRYPDRGCHKLRRKLADLHAVAIGRIVIGNGCSELIHLLASTLLGPGEEVLVVGPTFSEYRRATRLVAANVHECRATADAGFMVPLDGIASQLAARRTTLVWICNPNNPTGKLLPSEMLLDWAELHPQTLFVVDESYIEFATRSRSLAQANCPNLVVLRSMTKSMAIAGLRLGFAIAPASIADRLRERLIPWNVNALAQAAGIAALEDRDYYAAAIVRLRKTQEQFLSALVARGYQPVPSETNYFLIPIPCATAVRAQLLQHGLLVRDCVSFGIPDHLRLATRTATENARLCRRLAEIAPVRPTLTGRGRSATPLPRNGSETTRSSVSSPPPRSE